MLRSQLNNQITKEHYKEMAKIIADRHPMLADEGEDVPYVSLYNFLFIIFFLFYYWYIVSFYALFFFNLEQH